MCRVHPSGVNREKGQDIVADNVRPHAGNYRPPLGTVLRPWKELIPRLRKVFYVCRELRGTAEYLPNLACPFLSEHIAGRVLTVGIRL
jgi:hypothetical protein